MTALAEPLLDAPDLPEIVDLLQAKLAEEQYRRKQFLRDLTPSMKAEFINGEVLMHSPAKSRHINASDNAFALLRWFSMNRDLGRVMHEKALVSFSRNDYEPDVVFYRKSKARLIEPDQMRMPVPDLVVEVLSPSTESNDRGVKFVDYALHGVEEYWIVDCEAETVEVHHLPEGTKAYAKAPRLHGTDEIRSRVLPGLVFPAAALFDPAAHQAALLEIQPDGV
jgi:Uma2 family endonuclease